MRARILIGISSLLLLCGACRAKEGDGLKSIKAMDNYKILMGLKDVGDEGSAGKLVIEIQAIKGWKFNKKAPVVIKLRSPGGIELAKQKLRKKDASTVGDKKCRFELGFKKSKEPDSPLELKFDFVICTDTLCQKKRFTLSYTFPRG